MKLHGQSLAQRVIKYRIAGLIVEIREDNCIFVGQLGSRRGMRKRLGRHSAQPEEYDSRGCSEGGHSVPAEKLPGSVHSAGR